MVDICFLIIGVHRDLRTETFVFLLHRVIIGSKYNLTITQFHYVIIFSLPVPRGYLHVEVYMYYHPEVEVYMFYKPNRLHSDDIQVYSFRLMYNTMCSRAQQRDKKAIHIEIEEDQITFMNNHLR